jgi:hypothetical protein
MSLLNYLKTNQTNIENIIESYRNTIKICEKKINTYYPHINQNTSIRTQYAIAQNDIKDANCQIDSCLIVLELSKDKIEYLNKINSHENLLKILNNENELHYKLIKKIIDDYEDITNDFIDLRKTINSQRNQMILLATITICINMFAISRFFK